MTLSTNINVQLAHSLYTQIMINYKLGRNCTYVSIPVSQSNDSIIARNILGALLKRAAKSPAAGFLLSTRWWCYNNTTFNRIYLIKRINPKNKTRGIQSGIRGQK